MSGCLSDQVYHTAEADNSLILSCLLLCTLGQMETEDHPPSKWLFITQMSRVTAVILSTASPCDSDTVDALLVAGVLNTSL